MSEKKDNALVPRPPSGVERVAPGAKRILSDMVSDTLALAEQRALAPIKFRIGDYEWCEPDYQQILLWARETGLTPEEIVVRLLDQQSLRELPFDELGTRDFKEPLFADGKLLKVNVNLRLLPCSKLRWVNGLEITHLCVNAGEVTDLGPLPLPRLVWLKCQSLGLTHLDLVGMPQLEGLDCTGNRLEELDLSPVPKLVNLHCRKNELAELKFDQTPNISILNCWGNRLTQLRLSSLNRLRVVLCGENRLGELKLANLPILHSLSCQKNYLHELDLAGAPHLYFLDCSRNRLRRLDLSPLQSLSRLECADNAISELDLSSCPHLGRLDCSGNPISVLDIRGLKNLRTLNRSTNTKVIMDPEQKHIVQDLEAQFQMGVSLCSHQNYAEAARFFRSAAEMDHLSAQAYLGVCYRDGLGVSQDYAEAAKWFRKAAEHGKASAQVQLGHQYFFGEGVPENHNESAKWFLKAAEQGDDWAQLILGHHYHRGLGVVKDQIEAYKWFKLAAETGNKDASEQMMRLTSNLAPEDLQEGERRYSGLKERLARVTPNGKSIWKERHKKLIRMRRLLQILRSKRNFQTSSQKDPSERQG